MQASTLIINYVNFKKSYLPKVYHSSMSPSPSRRILDQFTSWPTDMWHSSFNFIQNAAYPVPTPIFPAENIPSAFLFSSSTSRFNVLPILKVRCSFENRTDGIGHLEIDLLDFSKCTHFNVSDWNYILLWELCQNLLKWKPDWFLSATISIMILKSNKTKLV